MSHNATNVHRNQRKNLTRDAPFVTLHRSQFIASFGRSTCSSEFEVTALSNAKFTIFVSHCSQLFGEHNEDEDVSPDSADPEAVASAGDAALTGEATESGNVTRVSTRKWAEEANYDPAKIFNKLFCDDIKYLLSMSDLWKKRSPPTPLRYGEFDDDMDSVAKSTDELQLNGNMRDQKVWNLRECQSVFATSLLDLQQEFRKLAEDDNLVWDKDDKAAMDFVAACANVRAIIFNIPQKSRFEIKCEYFMGIAGPPSSQKAKIISFISSSP